ncbi:MAG: HAD family hydrolase, partial [Clostridia bacterium]|nr:HAD family hydrolase [Clostridia bacterium]
MKYDLVIFDLDGTSLETIGDLAAAVNGALEKEGLPQRSLDQVRKGIGGGISNLVRVSSPEGTDEEVIKRLIADFKIRYTRDVNVFTHPFDGVKDMFRKIRNAGIRLAVNSNKTDDAVRILCESHFPGLIECIVGERPEFPRKPEPDGALHILKTMGIPAERALYIGDGDSDVLTAKNAGLDCAWVSWGYRTREELGSLIP